MKKALIFVIAISLSFPVGIIGCKKEEAPAPGPAITEEKKDESTASVGRMEEPKKETKAAVKK